MDITVKIELTPSTTDTLERLIGALSNLAVAQGKEPTPHQYQMTFNDLAEPEAPQPQPEPEAKAEKPVKKTSKAEKPKAENVEAARDSIREIIRQNVKSPFRDGIKALLEQFEAGRASDLADDQVPEFLTKLEKLVAA